MLPQLGRKISVITLAVLLVTLLLAIVVSGNAQASTNIAAEPCCQHHPGAVAVVPPSEIKGKSPATVAVVPPSEIKGKGPTTVAVVPPSEIKGKGPSTSVPV